VSERAQLKNLHPEGHRRLNLPVGVPLLQFYGMTVERRGGPVRGAAVYPDMLRWLRGRQRTQASMHYGGTRLVTVRQHPYRIQL
jgi:hypothetical protein